MHAGVDADVLMTHDNDNISRNKNNYGNNSINLNNAFFYSGLECEN